MNRFTRYQISCAIVLAASGQTAAQSLGEPSPVGPAFGVTQFGMPRDAKYIFCSDMDCPERTTKTLTSPPVVVVPQPITATVIPQSIQPPIELSRAKVKPVKKIKKKAVRRKRAVPIKCGPDLKK